jgi:hypothetical protein
MNWFKTNFRVNDRSLNDPLKGFFIGIRKPWWPPPLGHVLVNNKAYIFHIILFWKNISAQWSLCSIVQELMRGPAITFVHDMDRTNLSYKWCRRLNLLSVGNVARSLVDHVNLRTMSKTSTKMVTGQIDPKQKVSKRCLGDLIMI